MYLFYFREFFITHSLYCWCSRIFFGISVHISLHILLFISHKILSQFTITGLNIICLGRVSTGLLMGGKCIASLTLLSGCFFTFMYTLLREKKIECIFTIWCCGAFCINRKEVFNWGSKWLFQRLGGVSVKRFRENKINCRNFKFSRKGWMLLVKALSNMKAKWVWADKFY